MVAEVCLLAARLLFIVAVVVEAEFWQSVQTALQDQAVVAAQAAAVVVVVKIALVVAA
jgi:hypothetical protein